jgi:hypothetical protein
MLKHRLVFGTLMILVFVGLVLLDGWLDGSLKEAVPDKPIQATIFTLLIVLLAIPAQLELGYLIKQTGAHLFKSVTISRSNSDGDGVFTGCNMLTMMLNFSPFISCLCRYFHFWPCFWHKP